MYFFPAFNPLDLSAFNECQVAYSLESAETLDNSYVGLIR